MGVLHVMRYARYEHVHIGVKNYLCLLNNKVHPITRITHITRTACVIGGLASIAQNIFSLLKTNLFIKKPILYITHNTVIQHSFFPCCLLHLNCACAPFKFNSLQFPNSNCAIAGAAHLQSAPQQPMLVCAYL